MGSLYTRAQERAGSLQVYRDSDFGLIDAPKDGPAILLYDIETSPYQIRSWALRETNALKVERDKQILCFAYRWLNTNKVGFVAFWHIAGYQPGDLDEWFVAERLAVLFDRADITVAHNGDRFDRRTANAVFARHNLLPPSTYQTVDTLKVARREFKFDSNTLDNLARLAGLKARKLATGGMDMWFAVEDGDPKAQRLMERYNRRDVEVLEGVYRWLLPWIGLPGKPAHPNLGHWSKGERVCTNCGSTNLTPAATPHRGLVSEWETWRCTDCGAQSRSRIRKTQRGIGGVKTV